MGRRSKVDVFQVVLSDKLVKLYFLKLDFLRDVSKNNVHRLSFVN